MGNYRIGGAVKSCGGSVSGVLEGWMEGGVYGRVNRVCTDGKREGGGGGGGG